MDERYHTIMETPAQVHFVANDTPLDLDCFRLILFKPSVPSVKEFLTRSNQARHLRPTKTYPPQLKPDGRGRCCFNIKAVGQRDFLEAGEEAGR